MRNASSSGRSTWPPTMGQFRPRAVIWSAPTVLDQPATQSGPVESRFSLERYSCPGTGRPQRRPGHAAAAHLAEKRNSWIRSMPRKPWPHSMNPGVRDSSVILGMPRFRSHSSTASSYGHQHDDSDDFCLVLEGELLIDLPDRTVGMAPGGPLRRARRRSASAACPPPRLRPEPRACRNRQHGGCGRSRSAEGTRAMSSPWVMSATEPRQWPAPWVSAVAGRSAPHADVRGWTKRRPELSPIWVDRAVYTISDAAPVRSRRLAWLQLRTATPRSGLDGGIHPTCRATASRERSVRSTCGQARNA